MSRTKRLALLLAGLVLAAVPVRAAIARAGNNGFNSGTTTVSTFAMSVTTGLTANTQYAVVVNVEIAKDAATVLDTVINNGTGSLTSDVGISNVGNVRFEQWDGFITSDASGLIKVTVDLTATVKVTGQMGIYSGVAAFGVTGSGTTNISTVGISLTTQDSNNWCVAGFAGKGTGTFTASAGTLVASGVTSGGAAASNVGGELMDNTVASPGTCTNSGSSTDTAYAEGAVELRTVAPAACPKTLLMLGVGC